MRPYQTRQPSDSGEGRTSRHGRRNERAGNRPLGERRQRDRGVPHDLAYEFLHAGLASDVIGPAT